MQNKGEKIWGSTISANVQRNFIKWSGYRTGCRLHLPVLGKTANVSYSRLHLLLNIADCACMYTQSAMRKRNCEKAGTDHTCLCDHSLKTRAFQAVKFQIDECFKKCFKRILKSSNVNSSTMKCNIHSGWEIVEL